MLRYNNTVDSAYLDAVKLSHFEQCRYLDVVKMGDIELSQQ